MTVLHIAELDPRSRRQRFGDRIHASGRPTTRSAAAPTSPWRVSGWAGHRPCSYTDGLAATLVHWFRDGVNAASIRCATPRLQEVADANPRYECGIPRSGGRRWSSTDILSLPPRRSASPAASTANRRSRSPTWELPDRPRRWCLARGRSAPRRTSTRSATRMTRDCGRQPPNLEWPRPRLGIPAHTCTPQRRPGSSTVRCCRAWTPAVVRYVRHHVAHAASSGAGVPAL